MYYIENITIPDHQYKKIMKYFAGFFLLLTSLGSSYCQDPGTGQRTFNNPLFNSGADPWIIYNDGFYYYTNTSGSRLFLRKARNLDELKSAESVTVWTPPADTSYSKEIWAPELHFIGGKWYIYFAADDGRNSNHRMYVVENPSPDPTQGKWEFRGKVSDPSDKWAIDGSVFEYKKKLYFIWSGWEGDEDGRQDIYIALMNNPWTIKGQRIRISVPEYDWETVGDIKTKEGSRHVSVNEGPVILKNKRKMFLIYSASGCWTDAYCLGMLEFTGKDPLDKNAWKKYPEPVFKGRPEARAYAPGHNSFFMSPDGRENWILYHANPSPGQGCGRFRSPRAQKFVFKKDGSPDFGIPVDINTPMPLPSGSYRK